MSKRTKRDEENEVVGDERKKKKRKKNINFQEEIVSIMKKEKRLMKQSEVVNRLENKFGDTIKLHVKIPSSSVSRCLRKNVGKLFINPERGIYGLKSLEEKYKPYTKKTKDKKREKETSIESLMGEVHVSPPNSDVSSLPPIQVLPSILSADFPTPPSSETSFASGIGDDEKKND